MRTWFITGASRGFGALVAEKALACGDAVVASARDSRRIRERFGDHPNLLPVKLDVTKEIEAGQAVEAAIQRFGSIDVLVNNAGYGLMGAVEEATTDEIEKLYATNVFGLLKVTRAVLPQMRRQRSGRVLNFSSVGGYVGYTGFGLYCSTKFAVEGFSEALAAELAPLGIHVTIIEPGFFRTDFLDASSLKVSAGLIEDYTATVGPMREFAHAVNHNQPGNPVKLAEGVIALAGLSDPPIRMPFGADALDAIRAKNSRVTASLETWQELIVSTDFAAGA